ncbi:MAG TPA: F0F1 ATP synthase subunit A [Bryobacteraceae bacterium]|jgi:F-type H+-transporting ATPase subunit a|nr:F0F1 ATP synthase subunit A [Bryobacteraceae bacterium]
MPENEIWLTRFFNDYLAGAGNAALQLVGKHPEPRPWANFIVMQFLVVAILMAIFGILRSRLSADKPGGLQHIFELFYEFVKGQAEEQVGHAAHHYMAFFATIFLFVLTANLIGLVPILESPTTNASVTAGCALATFIYYNLAGVIAQGPLRYLAHFGGPMWWLAPLMFPIEIVSHLARILSLTVRLYANMFAGEQVTLVFLHLTKFIGPVVFMGLHIFVGVIQAYIFMLLTMVYVGGAVAHDH